jgi:hypothetical protein
MNFTDAIGPLIGIPIIENNLIPLHSIYAPTGAVMADRLGVLMDGKLYMHPVRFAQLIAARARPPGPDSADIARWSDDGGTAP